VTYLKAKIHIEDIAWRKSFRFIFYQALRILKRRGIPLPPVLFANDVTHSASEKVLTNYMIPKHNGCFIDVGANIGVWTFFVAKKGVTVHAFEPSPRPYKVLKKTAESYPNVRVYPYALGEDNYEAFLNLHFQSGHDGLVIKGQDFSGMKIKVPVRKLDSFNFKNVGLVKIDTEGFEVPILKGMTKTVKKSKPRLIIEVHMPIDTQIQKITTILKLWNYKWIIRYKQGVKRNPQPFVIGDPK